MRIVFDTGTFIALERRQKTALELLRVAAEDGDDLIAPAPVVAEWWRAGKREKERARTAATRPVASILRVATVDVGCPP